MVLAVWLLAFGRGHILESYGGKVSIGCGVWTMKVGRNDDGVGFWQRSHGGGIRGMSLTLV